MMRRLLHKLAHAFLRRWRRLTGLSAHILAEQSVGRNVTRLTVVAPARRVQIGKPDKDPFIPVSKYYRDGFFDQPDIFIAEVPGARVHIGSGLVCTPGWRALADAGRLDRLNAFTPFGEAKPRHRIHRSGIHSTINYCYASNPWHWVIDCLPKLLSLERERDGRPLTLLMPATLTEFQRDSMEALLPPNFTVEYLAPETWVESEAFLWPSLASGRCNALLPPGYFDEMRARVFARYGFSGLPNPHRRLYITRRNARHRRVKNEVEVSGLLAEFGFEAIEMENYSFRDQVELFRNAAWVAGPHGAGLVATVFSGPLHLLVFYATQRPPNYFHTQARALGQHHRFLLDQAAGEDDDFTVNLTDLRQLLQNEAA